MKKILTIVALSIICSVAHAQPRQVDSLLAKITQKTDPDEINQLLDEISLLKGGDLTLLKQEKAALARAEAEGNVEKQKFALFLICFADFELHDSPAMLEASLSGIRMSSDAGDKIYLSRFLHMAALAYVYENDNSKSAAYSLHAAKIALQARDTSQAIQNFSNLESDYALMKMPDSALNCARLELRLTKALKKANKSTLYRLALGDMAEAFSTANLLDSALAYYRLAYNESKNTSLKVPPHAYSYMLNNLARTFLQIGKPDSALKYAQQSYDLSSKTRIWDFTADAAGLLATLYQPRDDKKTLFYLKAEMVAKDSMNAADASRQFQLISDKDRQREDDLKNAASAYQARVRFYSAIAVLALVMAGATLLWVVVRKQRTANRILNEQKEEILAQRDDLETAYGKLKMTQTQLIQSEKMASLGELTAGIAHEIQNPLNFVNNFADVSAELVGEMETELKNGDKDEAIAISEDIKQNLEKIRYHGKRADAIVKGMLGHSRASTGQKEPANINSLADEYLRLSYHGLRAKDKSFNAEMFMHFDENLPKANIIAQDIGRVLLNLYNNAFYAVRQKAKNASPDYKPTVEVSTSQADGQVIISVKDNGPGIPEAIKDKIMQPFFTTKPTGEGTGLGLSLSYDIVVKGHGGSMALESKEDEGAEFIISLPLK